MGTGWFVFFLLTAALRLTWRAGKFGIARRLRLVIIEALQRATLHLFTKDAFDAAHHGLVLTGDERECVTGLSGAAGPADPVRISVGGIRHVVVNDVGYA